MKTKLLAGLLLAGSYLMAAPRVFVGAGVGGYVAPPPVVYNAPYPYWHPYRYWYGSPYYYSYGNPYWGYSWGWGHYHRWHR